MITWLRISSIAGFAELFACLEKFSVLELSRGIPDYKYFSSCEPDCLFLNFNFLPFSADCISLRGRSCYKSGAKGDTGPVLAFFL